MWEQLITKVNTTLSGVSRVKEVFFEPKENITQFPCVWVQPDGIENSFETGQENYAIYRFYMLVMEDVAGTTVENVFNTVLPKTVDAIMEKFDEDWDQATIDGHRVWQLISGAGPWQFSQEQSGGRCYAPLELEIKLLTDI